MFSQFNLGEAIVENVVSDMSPPTVDYQRLMDLVDR